MAPVAAAQVVLQEFLRGAFQAATHLVVDWGARGSAGDVRCPAVRCERSPLPEIVLTCPEILAPIVNLRCPELSKDIAAIEGSDPLWIVPVLVVLALLLGVLIGRRWGVERSGLAPGWQPNGLWCATTGTRCGTSACSWRSSMTTNGSSSRRS